MKQLYFSPLTRKVYFGDGKPLKENPGVSVIAGKRTDVTQSFFAVFQHMFPPGGKYLTLDQHGKPFLTVTVEECGESE